MSRLAKLERGELDLGAMVINEDAQLLAEAVRDRGLQILSLPNADALARRLPFKRVGRIVAGQYDPVRVLPGEAKDVLQVDTLIVGNRCARRSATQGFITVLVTVFPDFVRYNRDTPNRTGLPLAPAARSYFEHEGPDILGVYAPWVIDIMPTASWVQLILGISLLFKAKSLWHRFHLSRIDTNRMRTESAIPLLFGPGVTVGEIAEMAPSEKHRTPEAREQLDTILDQLATLLERSRQESQSVLVPMGEEMQLPQPGEVHRRPPVCPPRLPRPSRDISAVAGREPRMPRPALRRPLACGFGSGVGQLRHILVIGERERLGIDAIPQASGGGAVIENMAEMAITASAQDLRTNHAVAAVCMRNDVLLGHGLEEAGPAGAGVELAIRGEQGQPAADTAVDPVALIVQERAAERSLSALATSNLELFG